MKTIGTLEEIGAQVGDVVGYGGSFYYTIMTGKRLKCVSGELVDYKYWDSATCFSIITRAAKSPVRTVTRKEVVPGEYGRVQVFDGGAVSVTYCPYSDLTAAIATLTEIRDAMQDNT